MCGYNGKKRKIIICVIGFGRIYIYIYIYFFNELRFWSNLCLDFETQEMLDSLEMEFHSEVRVVKTQRHRRKIREERFYFYLFYVTCFYKSIKEILILFCVSVSMWVYACLVSICLFCFCWKKVSFSFVVQGFCILFANCFKKVH